MKHLAFSIKFIKYYIKTPHTMPRKFSVKLGTECLNTKFPAYPIKCGIQREAKKRHKKSEKFLKLFD